MLLRSARPKTTLSPPCAGPQPPSPGMAGLPPPSAEAPQAGTASCPSEWRVVRGFSCACPPSVCQWCVCRGGRAGRCRHAGSADKPARPVRWAGVHLPRALQHGTHGLGGRQHEEPRNTCWEEEVHRRTGTTPTGPGSSIHRLVYAHVSAAVLCLLLQLMWTTQLSGS